MVMEYLWLIVASAGFAVICGTVAYVLLEGVKDKTASDLLGKRTQQAANLSENLQKWVDRASKEMRVSFFQQRSLGTLMIMAVLAVGGFFAGSVYLHNMPAGILLAVGGVIVPEQVINTRQQMRREKIVEQMGAMVRQFAAEYSETPHIVRALGITGEKVPDPTGKILRNAYKGLISGASSDEVLIRLARDLNNEYGRMFVQLLRLGMEDEAVKPLFNKLALRLMTQQDLIKKSRVESSYDHTLMLILNFAIIPAFIIILRAVPESYNFFVNLTAGRFIVFMSVLSVVGAAFLERVTLGGGIE